MFNRKVFVSTIAFLISTAANAQLAPQSATPSTQKEEAKVVSQNPRAKEIVLINEEIAVLTAKLKKLETEEQIAAKQASINRYGAGSETSQDLPTVRGISGVDGQLRANLIWAGNVERVVKKGDVIRGAWTIAQIDVNAVTLKGHGKSVKLGFGGEPPSQQVQPGSPTLPGFQR